MTETSEIINDKYRQNIFINLITMLANNEITFYEWIKKKNI